MNECLTTPQHKIKSAIVCQTRFRSNRFKFLEGIYNIILEGASLKTGSRFSDNIKSTWPTPIAVVFQVRHHL